MIQLPYNKLIEWEYSANTLDEVIVGIVRYQNNGGYRSAILRPINGGKEVLEQYYGKYVAVKILAVGNSLAEVEKVVIDGDTS